MAKILYLSCHSILEFDEVRLLADLGHEVFSPGAYVEPDNPGDASLRPALPELTYSPEIVKQWHQLAGKHPGEDTKNFLEKEFVDNFDIVIVMHIPWWIYKNWEAIKHKRVIWRTIGQSISARESELAPYRSQGLEVVRYSPKERSIPGFIGEDALIRFYKKEDEYSDWRGDNNRVITFAQDMRSRGVACNFELFERVTKPFPRHLFGPRNEDIGEWTTGKISHQQQLEEYRANRCYFYTGTHPASYTLNFIEAFMTGIPIVAIGYEHGNANYYAGHDLYEIPDFIENRVNGFISDNERELSEYVRDLLLDRNLALEVGQRGRETAIRLFGYEQIKSAWQSYLGE